MIKEYVINHIRNNKTTSVSIAITSFLASLLLSLLTGIFYNLYADNIARGQTQTTVEIFAFLFILFMAMFSLILMIYNIFAMSMNSRLHQLGILKSVGATPKQIKQILRYEVIILSLVPIVIRTLLGIVATYILMQFIIKATELARDSELYFRYNILVAIISAAISL